MNNYTREDIMALVEEEDVEFIRLQFADIKGTMKNMAVTVSQLEKVLDNRCRFDGSSIRGFAEPEESDIYLHPDLNTFEIFPWRPQQGKVARFICDLYQADGTPYKISPRTVLSRVVNEAAEQGYQMNVGPECEFFLFHLDDGGIPTTVTHEQGGYFDVGPVDFGENARRDMVLTLEDMGFDVSSSYHETAPAQHEIDFQYDNALTSADNIMTFRMVVKIIAKRHGLHATFMPKPKREAAGSGMHINIALTKNGKNAFFDGTQEDGLSQEARYFVGGLMEHIKAITCITNPTINSYKRLVPGYKAPIYIGWAFKSRSPMIRVTSVKESDTRIELRSPDPTANPYLALAVIMAAGMDGIKNQVEPPRMITRNIHAMTDEERKVLAIESLPKSLEEAVNELEKDKFIQNVLGEELSQKFITAKKQEITDYEMEITEWELAHYLHKM